MRKTKRDKGRLKEFHVSAVIQFKIGGTDKKHARRIAEEAIFYCPKCFSSLQPLGKISHRGS